MKVTPTRKWVRDQMTQFQDTPETPSRSAMDIIRDRKVTHADGKELEVPVSMRSALDAATPEAPPAEEPVAEEQPQEPAAPAGEEDGEEEQRLPKSRFDQVNSRMHAAEAELEAERKAAAKLAKELAEVKKANALRDLEQGNDMPKGFDDWEDSRKQIWLANRVNEIHAEHSAATAKISQVDEKSSKVLGLVKDGFSTEASEAIVAAHEKHPTMSDREAVEFVKATKPKLFDASGSPEESPSVPASHASQPPRPTGSRKAAPKENPYTQALGMPDVTGTQRHAKAMEVLRHRGKRPQ